MEQLDSASYYNHLGYKESVDKNIKELLPYFILNEAATDYDRGRFQKSYDSVQKILPDFIDSKDVSNLVSCYYFLGMAAYQLDYEDQSISALKKVDSLILLLNDLEPEFGIENVCNDIPIDTKFRKWSYILSDFIKNA